MLLGRTPDFAPALRVADPGRGRARVVAGARRALRLAGAARPRARGRRGRRWPARSRCWPAPPSYSVANLGRSLSGNNVIAGPASVGRGFGMGGGAAAAAGRRAAGGPPSGAAPTGGGPPGAAATGAPPAAAPAAAAVAAAAASVASSVIAYLEAHQGSAKYLLAATGSQTTAPIIIETGKAVVTIGGFNGSDPAPTVCQLAKMVAEGELKYVLLSATAAAAAAPAAAAARRRSARGSSSTAPRPSRRLDAAAGRSTGHRLTTMILVPSSPHAVAAAALDGLGDGVLVVTEGKVLVANGAAHRLTGHRPGELAGGPAPAWVATAHAHGGTLELALPGGDGRRRRAAITVAPCPLPGGEPASLVTVHDRSAEAAREAELVRARPPRRPDGPAQPALVHRAPARGGRTASPRAAARSASLVVDLDHFKAVNDEYGHPVGDRVLAEAAARIAGRGARDPTPSARIGGEEFAWLLPDASRGRDARRRRARARGDGPARPFPPTACRSRPRSGFCDLASAGDADYAHGARRPGAVLGQGPRPRRRAAVDGRDRGPRRPPRGLTGPPDERIDALARLADEADPTPDGGPRPPRRRPQRRARRAPGLVARPSGPLASRRARPRRRKGAPAHRPPQPRPPRSRLPRPPTCASTPPSGPPSAADVLDPEQAPLGAPSPRALGRHRLTRRPPVGHPPTARGSSALAYAWDAMTTDRPYRRALGTDEALAEVERLGGRQFMPDAAALLRDALQWWEAA